MDDLISRVDAINAIVFNSENRFAVDVLNDVPAIDAIPVEWLCGKIRYEGERGNVLKAEYLKELIFEWHQSEVDA